jgi:hypothetical protein
MYLMTGYYFAWLGFYTTWLIFPAILGFIAFFYGVGASSNQTVSRAH